MSAAVEVLYLAPLRQIHADANLQVRRNAEGLVWVQFARGNEILAKRVISPALYDYGGSLYQKVINEVWDDGERELRRRLGRPTSRFKRIVGLIGSYLRVWLYFNYMRFR